MLFNDGTNIVNNTAACCNSGFCSSVFWSNPKLFR